MGLREDIQGLVAGVPGVLGNLADSLTYRQTADTYTPATSAVAASNTDTACTGKIVQEMKHRVTDAGAVITAPSVKVLIPALELPSVTPKVGDRVIQGSTTWIVDAVSIDPAGALWILALRRP
jgi:hypothetical protein